MHRLSGVGVPWTLPGGDDERHGTRSTRDRSRDSGALSVMSADALDAANDPGNPERVAPVPQPYVPVTGGTAAVTLPAWSVSTFMCTKS